MDIKGKDSGFKMENRKSLNNNFEVVLDQILEQEDSASEAFDKIYNGRYMCIDELNKDDSIQLMKVINRCIGISACTIQFHFMICNIKGW